MCSWECYIMLSLWVFIIKPCFIDFYFLFYFFLFGCWWHGSRKTLEGWNFGWSSVTMVYMQLPQTFFVTEYLVFWTNIRKCRLVEPENKIFHNDTLTFVLLQREICTDIIVRIIKKIALDGSRVLENWCVCQKGCNNTLFKACNQLYPLAFLAKSEKEKVCV